MCCYILATLEFYYPEIEKSNSFNHFRDNTGFCQFGLYKAKEEKKKRRRISLTLNLKINRVTPDKR